MLFFSFLMSLLEKAKSMQSYFSMSKGLEFKCIEIFRLNIFFQSHSASQFLFITCFLLEGGKTAHGPLWAHPTRADLKDTRFLKGLVTSYGKREGCPRVLP